MSKLEFTVAMGINDNLTWYSTEGDDWSSDYAIVQVEDKEAQTMEYKVYTKYQADHNSIGSYPKLELAIDAANLHRKKMLTEKEHDLF